MSKPIVELGADGCSVVLNLKKGTDPIIPLTSYSDEAQTIIRDLSTFSARMQFREDFDSDIIDELSTANNRIILGNATADPNIQLLFTQAALASYPEQCFADLELIDASGKIHPVDSIRFNCKTENQYTHD